MSPRVTPNSGSLGLHFVTSRVSLFLVCVYIVLYTISYIILYYTGVYICTRYNTIEGERERERNIIMNNSTDIPACKNIYGHVSTRAFEKHSERS